MAITVTLNKFDVKGSKRYHEGKFALDTSYPFGGYTLTANDLGLSIIDQVFVEGAKGLGFEFDHTNSKLQVFTQAPPIVWEERQTIASNAITLNYPPAFIFYVGQSGASIPITDPAATLANSQCKPTAAFTFGDRGGLTFASNLSSAVSVGYVTQAWRDVWNNLIQSEDFSCTASTGASLAYQPIAIQSVRAAGSIPTNAAEMGASVPAGGMTSKYVIPIMTTDKSLIFKSGDTIASGVVTYVQKPSSGFLSDRFIFGERLISPAAVSTCVPSFPLLLWSLAGQVPSLGATTHWLMPLGASLVECLGRLNLTSGTPTINVNSTSIVQASYVWGRESEIPGIISLEVRDGEDLSDVSDLRFFVTGS